MDKLREAEEARERIYILREEAAQKALARLNCNQEHINGPAKTGLHDLGNDVHLICQCCGERIDQYGSHKNHNNATDQQEDKEG